MEYNIGYIIRYMYGYDAGIPPFVILGVSVILCMTIILLFLRRDNGSQFFRDTCCCMLAVYVFLTLCTTVFFRESHEEMHYFLSPFHWYGVLYSKMLAEIILNILLFIPIGFFVAAVMRNRNILKTLCVGFVLSSTIEFIQLVSRRGVCSVDDVIHNTLGCGIGFVLFLISSLVFSGIVGSAKQSLKALN